MYVTYPDVGGEGGPGDEADDVAVDENEEKDEHDTSIDVEDIHHVESRLTVLVGDICM